MPDIAMRFHKDMLVLSTPVEAALARQGVNVPDDMAYTLHMEPETAFEALRIEKAIGAQCFVVPTASITPARLAHVRMQEALSDITRHAYDAVAQHNPQHILVEVGPCGLPLDESSKSSLNENKSNYARVAQAFTDMAVDAFFVNGFTSLADIKCALIGIAQVSTTPVFVSADVDAQGNLAHGITLEEFALAAVDLEAQVVGFATPQGIDAACNYSRRLCATVDVPVLAQLVVTQAKAKQDGPTAQNPYYHPDTMIEAAAKLYAQGVQFMRAAGNATPAYTGALVATLAGLDVRNFDDGDDLHGEGGFE